MSNFNSSSQFSLLAEDDFPALSANVPAVAARGAWAPIKRIPATNATIEIGSNEMTPSATMMASTASTASNSKIRTVEKPESTLNTSVSNLNIHDAPDFSISTDFTSELKISEESNHPILELFSSSIPIRSEQMMNNDASIPSHINSQDISALNDEAMQFSNAFSTFPQYSHSTHIEAPFSKTSSDPSSCPKENVLNPTVTWSSNSEFNALFSSILPSGGSNQFTNYRLYGSESTVEPLSITIPTSTTSSSFVIEKQNVASTEAPIDDCSLNTTTLTGETSIIEDVVTSTAPELNIDEFPLLCSNPSTSAPPAWIRSGNSSVPLAPPPITSPTPSTSSENEEIEIPTLGDKKSMKKMTHGTPIPLISNSYHMDLGKATIYQFNVEIRKVFKLKTNPAIEATKILTGEKQSTPENKAILLKVMMKVFDTLHRKAFAYDGARSLYALSSLERKANKGCIHQTIDYYLIPKDIKDAIFKDSTGHLEVDIVLHNTFELNDIINETIQEKKRIVTPAVHIALTQFARNEKFVVLPGNEIFESMRGKEESPVQKQNNNEKFDISKLARVGLELGVRIGEGENGIGEPLLCLGHRKSNFFIEGPLESVKEYLPIDFSNSKKCRHLLNNIEVMTEYDQKKISITGFSENSVERLTFKHKGEENNVLENSSKLAKKRLEEYNKSFVAAQTSFGKNPIKFCFPIENLRLLPDQRMGPQQGPPPTPSSPQERFDQSREMGVKIGVLQQNPILKAFKINVNPEPIQVEGKVLNPPKIFYSGENKKLIESAMDSSACWKVNGNFYIRSEIKKVLILYYADLHDKILEELVLHFKEDLLTESAALARKLENSTVGVENLKRDYANLLPEKALEKKLSVMKARNQHDTYVIFIDEKKDNASHGFVKLQERLSETMIQHVASDEALKKKGKSIIQFIVMKMNVKSGGLNHSVRMGSSIENLWGEKSNTLIVSYDVCHSAGNESKRSSGTERKKGFNSQKEEDIEPSAVGFAFNGSRHPEQIIGDFHITRPGEKVDHNILVEKVHWMLQTYFDSRRKCPDNIIILRDGVSKGQYKMVVEKELKALIEGIHKFMKEKGKLERPKIAYIIVTKRHSHRLFVKNEKIENAPPLTVVDRRIVRKDEKEILFVAHAPLNGTAHPMMLNTVFNDIFDSYDQLMSFIAALCCSHQRSTSIISLPETIYVADAYAKRGADLFAAYKYKLRTEGRKLPKGHDNSTDLRAITNLLSYQTSSRFKGKCMV